MLAAPGPYLDHSISSLSVLEITCGICSFMQRDLWLSQKSEEVPSFCVDNIKYNQYYDFCFCFVLPCVLLKVHSGTGCHNGSGCVTQLKFPFRVVDKTQWCMFLYAKRDPWCSRKSFGWLEGEVRITALCCRRLDKQCLGGICLQRALWLDAEQEGRKKNPVTHVLILVLRSC